MPFKLDPVQASALIRARAEEVRKMGTYVGMFEFLVFSSLTGTRVKLLANEYLIDLVGMAGNAGYFGKDSEALERVVVGCRATPTPGELLACTADKWGCNIEMNHYVVGERLTWRKDLSGKPGGAPILADVPLRVIAASAGFSIHETQACGDCGIDAMCYFRSRPRSNLSFEVMRNFLADGMLKVADDPAWQQSFGACDELPQVDLAAAALPAKIAFVSSGLCGEVAVVPSGLCGDVSGPAPELAPVVGAPSPPSVGEEETKVLAELSGKSIAQALRDLGVEESARVTEDYLSFEVFRKTWSRANPRTTRAPSSRSIVKATKMSYRLAIGLDYLRWEKSKKPSGASDAKVARDLKGYATHKWKTTDKKHRQWLANCVKLVQAGATLPNARGFGPKSKDTVQAKSRLRVRGAQGRPLKMPMLNEFVWDWFVDIKASVAARIHPRLVLLKAKSTASALIKDMNKNGLVKKGKFLDVPVLDSHLLFRWKKRYGVSLQKPNRRYKCSRVKLLSRLRAMWVFNVRVRALAVACLGHDLPIMGCDQKPLHFNEEGSKCCKTLHFMGAPEVPLKENHSATRERFSLFTTVYSDRAAALAPGGPHLEVLFRGKEKDLAELEVPSGVNISLGFGPKGSYRLEQCLIFLRRALAPWTVARADANDYRMLYLDAYKAHMADEVKELAWERGYVLCFHWGCTTGICQVNDTDLHQHVEREYQYWESKSFADQQLLDAGNISRTRQQVLDDVVKTWAGVSHEIAAQGHLRVGLSNSLHSHDDRFLIAPALTFWNELDMFGVRAREVAEVNRRVLAGELTWSRSSLDELFLVPDDGDRGVAAFEGMEAEGALAEDEVHWSDSDISEDDGVPAIGATVVVPLADVVEASDPPEAVAAAKAFEDKKYHLEQIMASAKASGSALPVQWYVDRQMKDLLKEHAVGGGGPEKEATDLMKRFLARQRDAEQSRICELQELAKKKALEKKRVKNTAKVVKARATRAAADKRKRTAALALYPGRFTIWDMGQGQKDGGKGAFVTNRIAYLNRLRARSPALPPELDKLWPDLARRYASRYIGNLKKATVGQHMIELVTRITTALGMYLIPDASGVSLAPSGSPESSDQRAFQKWVKDLVRLVPKEFGAESEMTL